MKSGYHREIVSNDVDTKRWSSMRGGHSSIGQVKGVVSDMSQTILG